MENNSLDEKFTPPINSIDLEAQFNLFSQIFAYEEFNADFLEYLKEIEKPSNNVCAKIFEGEEKAIRCLECSKYDTSIICLDCYEKTKEFHKSHTILYEMDVEGGCCDCGNGEVWDKKSFCSLHKGTFSNEEEINKFIKNNFDDNTIEKIKNWFNNIINLLVPYFLEMEKNNNILNNNNLREIVKNFLEFLFLVFKNNSALIQLFCQLLIKNYPFETNHNCVVINENNETKLKKYKEKKHLCECSFLKILFSVWTDNINKEEFLFFFLQNNKMKIYIALTYISIYNLILENDSKDLQSFIIQVLNSEIVLNSIKSSPFLITKMFKCFYHFIEKSYKSGNLEKDVEKIKIFCNDIHCILRGNIINLISDNIELFENYLNTIELLNNFNSFEIVQNYQREGYCFPLVIIELYLLNIFINLISFFNFNNKEITIKLLQIYEDKFKHYKFLNLNTYSFHIILLRSFSIFLNRFCLYYSIKFNSNFYDSMKYIKSLIPNYENIFDIIIKEQMKFFGFLCSIEYNFFIYYGEDMKKYIIKYFNSDIFPFIDFNLIKLILCQEENVNYFSISKIFELCDVNKSFTNLIPNDFRDSLSINFDYIIEEKEEKKIYLKKKLLEFFIKIIKDDSSFFLLYDYSLKNKKNGNIKDEFEQYFLENEDKSICNLIKERIINYSIVQQNSYTYADFNMYNEFYIFNENKIRKIFEEMTYKTTQNDGQIKYSLNNEYIKQCDLDYILNPLEISDAQKYIIDFKKQEVSLLNNYFYDTFHIFKKANNSCLYNFFYFNKNIELLIDFCIKLISNIEYNKISYLFFQNAIKFILVFMYIDKNIFKNKNKKEKEGFYIGIKSQLNKLLNFLNEKIISSNDEEKKLLYKYIKINILKYLDIEIKENIKENVDKKKDNKKLKETYKKIFKERKFEFLKQYNLEKEEDSEICIVCRLPLANKKDDDIFGIIGTTIKDYFFEHCKYFIIKSELIKYNKNKEINFNLYNRNNKELNIRILTCNHKLHFNCYNQLIVNISFFSDTIEFSCPLCKKIGRIFIPCFNLIYNNYKYKEIEINNIFSGFKLNDFFNEDSSIKEKIDENIFISPFNPKIQNILNCSISFIENILDGKLISSLKLEQNIPYFLEILYKKFSNFLIYNNICDNSEAQIEIWTNLILSLRVLLKTKMININKLLEEFNNSINFFNIKEEYDGKINLNFFKNIYYKKIEEVLLLSLILFDFENVEKILIDLFSPFISIISFIKNIFIKNGLFLSPMEAKKSLVLDNFNYYINDKNSESYLNLKIAFDNFLVKIYIFKLINNKKLNKEYTNNNQNNNKIINLYKEFSLEIFENKPISCLIFELKNNISLQKNPLKIFIDNDISNKKRIEIIYRHLNTSLEIISLSQFINPDLLIFDSKIDFKFISLEKTLLEHVTSIQKKKCIYCGKDKNSSLICLLCGEKICGEPFCIPKENNILGMNSVCLHSKNCNYGNNIYITDLGKIMVFYKYEFIFSFNGIYLNQFGDEYKNYGPVTNNYRLNERNYEKMEKRFINYYYRKK